MHAALPKGCTLTRRRGGADVQLPCHALPPPRRFFEASEVLAAASWELQNHFRIGSSSGSGGAATALSWRQPAPGLPPLLLVGTAQAGAQIWVHQQQLMRWEQVASPGSPQVRTRSCQEWHPATLVCCP